ncbi:MAG: flagellar hook-length control protein FliK [Alphaproteobacteria bacterium]|nr:flagellar hook-length control protein FliK [Alphaproteobacteria bacterium]
MDMNEVNKNSVAALLLQGRQNVVNSAVSGQGFAELLAAADVKVAPEAELSSEVKNSSVSSKNTSYKTNAADKEVKKESAPVKEKTEKKEKVKNTSDDYKKTEAKNDNGTTVADNQTAKPVAEKTETAEENTSVADVSEETPVISEGEAVEEKSVETYKLPLDFIASLDFVSVFNPDTHESFQMTGVELAEKLAAGEFPNAMIMYLDNGRDVSVSDEVAAMSEEISVDGEGLVEELTVPEDNLKADNEKQVRKVAENNGKIELPEMEGVMEETVAPVSAADKQAKKIAELLDDGRKVKIEVNVDEESFSYRSAKEMTISLIPVEENAAEKVETVSVSENNSVISSSGNQQPAQMSQISAPVAAPAVQAVSENAGTVSAVSSEPAPVSLANAGAQSGEVVNQGKLAAANDDKTSFREVYKGLSRETIDQIKVNITKSAVKGVDKIQIQLKPEDLGSIEVKMQIGKDGKLQAHIISGRPETMDVLQKEIASLEKAFSDAGFQMDEGSLSFSFRESNSQNGQGHDEELRQFIGNVFEQETVQEQVAGDEYLSGTASNGLNIRV